MEEFLLDDYNKKIRGKEAEKVEARKAKVKRAIALFNEGLRDLDVIAEALEVSEETVKNFLGKRRTEICLGIVDEKPKEKPKNATREKQPKKSQEIEVKPKRFTEKDAENYAKRRDMEIRDYHLVERLNADEIAGKCHMTKKQVEERLIAMGLPIYSEEDLEDLRMRKEEEEKRRQEAMKEPEKAEISVTEESSRDNEEIAEEVVEETEVEAEEEHQIGYRSFEEIKKAMKMYIKDRKSTIALDIARYYSIERHSDFLTEEERKKLEAMADTIKIFRDRDRVRKAKER